MIPTTRHKFKLARRVQSRRRQRNRLAYMARAQRSFREPREFWFTPALPGWPGWRIRPGRSGYDPIDYQLEFAHIQGVLVRKFITFKFRSQSWLFLLMLTIMALAFLTSGLFALYALMNPVVWDLPYPYTRWLVLGNVGVVLLYGLIGVFILINVAFNVRILMESTLTITDLDAQSSAAIEQCAALLVESFKEHWPEAWPEIEDARKEMQEALAEGKICRIATDSSGNVLGWIGGIPQYDGLVWELHPLVVKPESQQQGIGRQLVQDFEQQVLKRGGLTITLGSDDDDQMTSLSNVNLYENTWEKIQDIRNLKGHPYEFYQKLGYVITGVVPDANGRGRPDIIMSKRVG